MANPMDRSDPSPNHGAEGRSLPEEARNAEQGEKGRDMNAVHHPSRLEEQRPVSWAGWLLALVAGAALWVLVLKWLWA